VPESSQNVSLPLSGRRRRFSARGRPTIVNNIIDNTRQNKQNRRGAGFYPATDVRYCARSEPPFQPERIAASRDD
jgi:hypothetical protein